MCCHVDCIVHMKEFCISCSLRTAMSAMALSLGKTWLRWWSDDKIMYDAIMMFGMLEDISRVMGNK